MDINFCLDPLCPFAQMTSKCVGRAPRGATVPWTGGSFSLCMINADVDYGSYLPVQATTTSRAATRSATPPGYGLLRVAARIRTGDGRKAVGLLDQAIGTQVFDCAALALEPEERGRRRHLVREVA